MSNKEYLTTILGKFGVSSDEINVILLEQDILPNGEVNGKNEITTLKKAIYYQLPLMLAGMQNVSEGGYSISWNLDGIKLWYSALAKDLGLPDNLVPKPTARGKSPW